VEAEFAHVGMDTRVCFHGLILISLALILSSAATLHPGGGLLASHQWHSDDYLPSSLSLWGRSENHQLFQSDAVHRVLRKARGLSFTGEKPDPRMKSLASLWTILGWWIRQGKSRRYLQEASHRICVQA